MMYVNKEGRICMVYCLKCKTENYGPAVASGKCAWCGYDPNIKKSEARRIKIQWTGRNKKNSSRRRNSGKAK